MLLEIQAYARAQSMNVEALQAAALFSKFRSLWDWKIVDENGKVVWASDLANRYRNQTKPRGVMRF